MGRTHPLPYLMLLAMLLALLPAPHPEARLFSGDWGASSFVDADFCLTSSDGGPAAAPRFAPVFKPPAVTAAVDRLALALLYLGSGLLLPVLAVAAVFHPRHALAPARHPALLMFGLLGFAPAWFQWPRNPAFIGLRQWLAEAWLTRWPLLESQLPLLDGIALSLWLAGGTLLAGGAVFVATALAARLAGIDRHRMAAALLPLAGVTVFLGLTQTGALYLRGEGLGLDWLPGARAALLSLAVVGSVWQGLRLIQRVGAGGTANRLAAGLLWLLPSALFALHGWAMYFHWTGRYHV